MLFSRLCFAGAARGDDDDDDDLRGFRPPCRADDLDGDVGEI
jgi:hypothetical protein